MNKHELYMDMIKLYSNFSRCTFTKVGAMAVNQQGRIVATGVNGTLPGAENCCDHSFDNREDHVQYTLENEIHAEENLILELANSGINHSRMTIYVTLSPCSICLKHLLGLTRDPNGDNVVIERIVYNEKYHRTTDEQLLAMKEKAARAGCELTSLESIVLEEAKTVAMERINEHRRMGIHKGKMTVDMIRAVWMEDADLYEAMNATRGLMNPAIVKNEINLRDSEK